MTNKKMTYDQFISTYCGCKADHYGNRPCDYGMLCDKCMTEDMQNLWEKIKKEGEK